jgi:hypothetical protein
MCTVAVLLQSNCGGLQDNSQPVLAPSFTHSDLLCRFCSTCSCSLQVSCGTNQQLHGRVALWLPQRHAHQQKSRRHMLSTHATTCICKATFVAGKVDAIHNKPRIQFNSQTYVCNLCIAQKCLSSLLNAMWKLFTQQWQYCGRTCNMCKFAAVNTIYYTMCCLSSDCANCLLYVKANAHSPMQHNNGQPAGLSYVFANASLACRSQCQLHIAQCSNNKMAVLNTSYASLVPANTSLFRLSHNVGSDLPLQCRNLFGTWPSRLQRIDKL